MWLLLSLIDKRLISTKHNNSYNHSTKRAFRAEDHHFRIFNTDALLIVICISSLMCVPIIKDLHYSNTTAMCIQTRQEV